MTEDRRYSSQGFKMEGRQLWNNPRPSSTVSGVATCTPVILPSGGIVSFGTQAPITLTEDTVFQPACTGHSDVVLVGSGSPTSLTDFRDPFYASTLPECYALATATVIAYMLVIMLLITPRTFLYEGAVALGRRGFTNGPSGGGPNGIGIGGRPWLQKVAACSVAIALTIATADTFAVAEYQYNKGYMDAAALQAEVEDGQELRIFRVISDTFLWLAQAQTLIRLFPRQREKIIIKWTAFALISLDVLFSILNNFVFRGGSRPRNFVEAIPALSYLFQLSLSLLYCAWVFYYSLTKRRFAFYHPQMRNQCLVALLSLVSVLIPVVFFVVDISKPEVAGWGDYVRWVGAAAASVVVWEWVERIEALERNEKKDGVLGREVFDGDEMLETTPTCDSSREKRFKNRKKKDDGKGSGDGGASGGVATGSNGISWPGVVGIANRYRPRPSQDIESGLANETADRRGVKKGTKKKDPHPRPSLWPARPAPAATPVSRTDTASAESTVYAVRYHPLSEATPPSRGNTRNLPPAGSTENVAIPESPSDRPTTSEDGEKSVIHEHQEDAVSERLRKPTAWDSFSKIKLFRRKNQGPPLEVSAHAVRVAAPPAVPDSSSRWDVRAKIEDFAVTQADRIRERAKGNDTTTNLPVTIIPAPSRRRYYEAALEEHDRENEIHETQASYSALQADVEPAIQSRSQRTANRPDDQSGHSLHQQGAISFVTAVPQERLPVAAPEQLQPGSRQPQPDGERDALSSTASPIQVRSPASATFPASARRDGLPVVTIPAPPRRPRSPDDE